MTLQEFNSLPEGEAQSLLLQCCNARKWVNGLLAARPFATELDLIKTADAIWYQQCNEADWLEAFKGHPKIGDRNMLAAKFATTSHLAGDEQRSVNDAPAQVIDALADANARYESQNGFIFIVCASGKPAEEMLTVMHKRLLNSRSEELAVAMGEQQKISIIRLKKILPAANWSGLPVSHLTTHVLDTSLGKPGKDISISLKKLKNNQWEIFALGITNGDGRVPDLLPAGHFLTPGNYCISFDTGGYYERLNTRTFYPSADIQFTIFDQTHYHVPLLVNPFGYSTYRGS